MNDDDYSDEELRIDGKIINGTYSTRTPKIKASKIHLLRHHQTLGCLIQLALLVLLPFLAFLLLNWMIAAVIFGVLSLAALGFIAFATHRISEISENAVLTASMVVSESPLQLLALVDMNNGGSDSPVFALKLVEFANIPCHACTIHEVIPCVSGFRGDDFDKWSDFFPEPLSFATGDTFALQKNTELLEAEELALLRKHIAAKSYPTEPKELQWITEEAN